MVDANKNPAAVSLGRRGGEAGTGKAKRRNAEHYARISRLGGQAAKKKRKEMSDLQRQRSAQGKVKGNSRNRRTAKRRIAQLRNGAK